MGNVSLFHLGDRARDRREWPAAASLYQDALVSEPENPALWVQYGHACKEAGLIGRAEAAYRQAIFLAPRDHDVRLQLGHLLKSSGDDDGAIKHYRESHALLPGGDDAARELRNLGVDTSATQAFLFDDSVLIVDVSDLLQFARKNLRPSGIQRVQTAVVDALLTEDGVGRNLGFVARASNGEWVHVPTTLLRDISGRLRGEPVSVPAAADGEVAALSVPMRWPRGATYLMLGTAWDDAGHSSALNALKKTANLRLISFIHDLIPVERPDLCVTGLPARFRPWLIEALAVMDGWVSNSRYTASRLAAFAQSVGLPAPVVTAVPLDAPLPMAGGPMVRQLYRDEYRDEVTRLLGFDPETKPFVLCVGTIEPRKNHKVLLAAWHHVCEQVATPPTLVITGAVGWNSYRVLQLIKKAQDDGLDVRHVNGLSDGALDVLYSRCAFMVYPSLLEGWGLPVAEALAHGKIPVVGQHSGVAEASSGLGYYVNVESVENLATAMVRLLVDTVAKRRFEEQISARYRSRTWLSIAHDIIDAAFLGKIASGA